MISFSDEEAEDKAQPKPGGAAAGDVDLEDMDEAAMMAKLEQLEALKSGLELQRLKIMEAMEQKQKLAAEQEQEEAEEEDEAETRGADGCVVLDPLEGEDEEVLEVEGGEMDPRLAKMLSMLAELESGTDALNADNREMQDCLDLAGEEEADPRFQELNRLKAEAERKCREQLDELVATQRNLMSVQWEIFQNRLEKGVKWDATHPQGAEEKAAAPPNDEPKAKGEGGDGEGSEDEELGPVDPKVLVVIDNLFASEKLQRFDLKQLAAELDLPIPGEDQGDVAVGVYAMGVSSQFWGDCLSANWFCMIPQSDEEHPVGIDVRCACEVMEYMMNFKSAIRYCLVGCEYGAHTNIMEKAARHGVQLEFYCYDTKSGRVNPVHEIIKDLGHKLKPISPEVYLFEDDDEEGA